MDPQNPPHSPARVVLAAFRPHCLHMRQSANRRRDRLCTCPSVWLGDPLPLLSNIVVYGSHPLGKEQQHIR
jgi:hypothetical protein